MVYTKNKIHKKKNAESLTMEPTHVLSVMHTHTVNVIVSIENAEFLYSTGVLAEN